MNADTPTFLTEREFCARYRLTPKTAQRWRAKGEGPAYICMGPRRIVYRLADCEQWVEVNTIGTLCQPRP